jgi:hypothetical protein
MKVRMKCAWMLKVDPAILAILIWVEPPEAVR